LRCSFGITSVNCSGANLPEHVEQLLVGDPLKIMADWMIDQGIADAQTIENIAAETKAEMEQGADFAVEAPYPDASEVENHVYAD